MEKKKSKIKNAAKKIIKIVAVYAIENAAVYTIKKLVQRKRKTQKK